ncbi:MAG: hypothetical protein ACQ9MH_17100 [Nitrospinales bacterium]
MRILTDKAIQFRTFPVVPRKRVKFNPDTAVEVTEFGSNNVVFKCLGGYFTHNSYRLFDYFVSHWFEIAHKNWLSKYGDKYPSNFFGNNVEKLTALTPILNMEGSGSLKLENDLLGICLRLKKYVSIDAVSDRAMRSHASLKGISSAALKDIIEKTAHARLKASYSIRTVKADKKRKILGYNTWSNLSNSKDWSKIFDYRIVDEVAGTDGRILERIYKFSFKSPLGVAMIHNTICGGSWSVNPALYQVSADAQLLYRYLVITGSRRKNNTAEYLAHRLGWREKQKSRVIPRLKILFEEICAAGLIQSYEASENHRYGCLISYALPTRKRKKKPGQ